MDRNLTALGNDNQQRSLSARRAWIEIAPRSGPSIGSPVALRKESVDRNTSAPISISSAGRSLSARRAWIEIIGLTYDGLIASVALRKESVDRNLNSIKRFAMSVGRSPQGERG